MLVACRGANGSVEVPAADVQRSEVLVNASETWQPGEGPLDLSDLHIADFRLWLTGPLEHEAMDLDQALRCLEVACRLSADCERWASGVHLSRQSNNYHLSCSAVHWSCRAVQVQSVID